ncbi:probable polygalacturonase At1g80170 [Humulus lupulus]|uniref:probable polygalacturonase At1g80170 n=1 Tax=Humulus lupulus TaxID=3486 RepID=UPI002B40FCCE|nr:probable polygalacturonase At1g80170 [Humulus lupulus]
MDLFGIIYIVTLVCTIPNYTMAASSVANILNYGAAGNGVTDDSSAFSKAWNDTCASVAENSTLLVPSGHTFLVHSIIFSGPCKPLNIFVQLDGGIVAPNGPNEWKGSIDSLILFEKVDGLTLSGTATIDGRGKGWWDASCARHPQLKGCYGRRPTALKLVYCTRVKLLNIHVINSPQVHVIVWNSQNVEIDTMYINSPALSPNTDGFHIEASTNVSVVHSIVKAGDDCISIGDKSSYIHVRNLFCGPGHGISIGSLGIGGSVADVHNIDVHRVHFFGTTNGVRIKTYQVGKGIVQHVTFNDLNFHHVQNPIVIDQHYCFDPHGCPDLPTAVHIDNVTYSNVVGTASSEIALNLNCSKSAPCTNINFKEIRLKPEKPLKSIKSSCNNAHGSTTGVVKPASCLHG